MALEFNGLLLDVERRELCRDSLPVKLEPKVFDLLVYLVRHRNRVVGKEELIDRIWNGRIISDAALTTRINGVRRALGDTGKDQHLIRTYRGKGFRFIGNVVNAAATPQPSYFKHNSGVSGGQLKSAVERIASVTVLPFLSLSGDLEERCFAESLSEGLVVGLTRFGWLSVFTPNTHLFSNFDGTGVGGQRAFRAAYLLKGAACRAEKQIRIQVQLIDVSTGSILWADAFDGSLADPFALQHKLALTIVGSVEPQIQLAEGLRFESSLNPHATPYELHLQAHPIFSSGRRNVLRSLALLEKAVALDPAYAPALADLANCLQILDVNGWIENREQNRRRAKEVARLALQASSDAVHVAISAFVLAYFGENIEAAMGLLDQALALNPAFAKGWYMSGMTRLYAGQPEAAIEHFETSIQLNPRDRLARRNGAGLGMARFFSRQFDDAISLLRPIIEEFPRWSTPYCVLASCHAHLGFVSDAQAISKRLGEADATPVPNAMQFRDTAHRQLLVPGLRLTRTSTTP